MKKTITYNEVKKTCLDVINGGGGGGGKSKLSELNDVTITRASEGQVLKYNGTKWVNGTAGGGASLKTFTFTADGTDGKNIPIPSDAVFILGIRSVKADGGEVSYMGFPVVDGVGMCAGGYNITTGYGTLSISYTISNGVFKITGGADIGAKLYDNGQVSTFYYI